MANYTDSVCRQCCREGQKLFLQGERCHGEKCAANCRPYTREKSGYRRHSGNPAPKWMDLDADSLMIDVTALPEREDVGAPIEGNLIVELYSEKFRANPPTTNTMGGVHKIC